MLSSYSDINRYGMYGGLGPYKGIDWPRRGQPPSQTSIRFRDQKTILSNGLKIEDVCVANYCKIVFKTCRVNDCDQKFDSISIQLTLTFFRRFETIATRGVTLVSLTHNCRMRECCYTRECLMAIRETIQFYATYVLIHFTIYQP